MISKYMMIWIIYYSVGTGPKVKIHKKFLWFPEQLSGVLRAFNLDGVSIEQTIEILGFY